jgi:DinB superfamily
VMHERCDECGFDGAVYDDTSLLDAVRSLGPAWRALLATAGSDLRVRPEPLVWSAIEYAAHSRDITALHVYGVEQALSVDEPVIPAIVGDLVESAAATYGTEDPDAVVAELSAHATELARAADAAGAASWSRGITIGDSRIDVRGLLEHALHDSLHHVRDVERGLVRLRARL